MWKSSGLFQEKSNTGKYKTHSPQLLQVQENLNSSVSPCTDMWAAVCSKYSDNSIRLLDRAVWNQKQMIVQKGKRRVCAYMKAFLIFRFIEAERLRDFISTLELPLHTGTVEWKLKHLYESCLDVDTLGIDGARPLSQIISQLGKLRINNNNNNNKF